jgi:hypothetical protein
MDNFNFETIDDVQFFMLTQYELQDVVPQSSFGNLLFSRNFLVPILRDIANRLESANAMRSYKRKQEEKDLNKLPWSRVFFAILDCSSKDPRDYGVETPLLARVFVWDSLRPLIGHVHRTSRRVADKRLVAAAHDCEGWSQPAHLRRDPEVSRPNVWMERDSEPRDIPHVRHMFNKRWKKLKAMGFDA